MSLRRLLTPFVKRVHPDLLSHASAQVKRTNERSLQQLNTIIDTLEHLGGRALSGSGRGGGRGAAGPAPHLEASYELTFHLVEHHDQQQQAKPASSSSSKSPPSSPPPTPSSDAAPQQEEKRHGRSFTARLLFPATTVARFQREAPLAQTTHPPRPTTTPESPPPPSAASLASLLPDEIAHQLRKLFLGARLRVPRELEEAAGGGRRGEGGGGRRRRGGMIGAAEAERLLVADLMGRDLSAEGPTLGQRRAAVHRLLRSGRVLTKGLGPAEEVGALRQLEQVLVQEWDRAFLDVAATAAGAGPGAGGKGGLGGLQIVLDAGADMLRWEVLADGRGHLLVVPAEDVKGSRYRLAAVLREIGQRAMGARGEAGGGV